MTEPTSDAVASVWRAESARLVGALTRLTRDLDLAEDLAQDALVNAMEQWPSQGIPTNPASWLMSVAKRRGMDSFRRAQALQRKTQELAHGRSEVDAVPDPIDRVDFIEDDVLRLIFLSCHPVLSKDSRAALTLRLVGGLTTAEIARGFLSTEKTMGQRISRAKATLKQARVGFDLPTGAERRARLGDVMAVIYLIFNEGYTATSGTDWMRPELTDEGIRLARMLADLASDEPETHGLQALLELQASRLAARLDNEGNAVLLDEQDRGRWDEVLIRRGLAALSRSEALAAAGRPVGRYFLQAQIASVHARSRSSQQTDWAAIARWYDLLADAAPGPVVEVNRAVAHGRAFGAQAGLEVLDAIADDALAGSHLPWSVRGDLLFRDGRYREAAECFRQAAASTQNEREREVLLTRARQAEAP